MKCLMCQKWGKILCSYCLPQLSFGMRTLDELNVYSFYAYSEIEALLHYKYTSIGSRVFHLLALQACEYFKCNVKLPQGIFGVGIDDCVKKGYSHNGVFLHCFKQCGIKPIYGELLAKNVVSYAGKDLDFRQKHPKGFESKLRSKTLVLFDDIITTGTSLKEAKTLLVKQDNEVLFALTLCDASR